MKSNEAEDVKIYNSIPCSMCKMKYILDFRVKILPLLVLFVFYAKYVLLFANICISSLEHMKILLQKVIKCSLFVTLQ